MTTSVRRVSRDEIRDMVASWGNYSQSELEHIARIAFSTAEIWEGKIDGVLVCTWGLMPQTLLSNTAYLWLWTSEALRGHEFTFVRQSQIAVAKMLETYPTITGHAVIGQYQSIRWLRWLGAKFLDPCGGFIPFYIVKE